jgi:PAS domain S-box-containing protein
VSPERLVRGLQRAALASYGLVALLGMLAIWGWAAGLPRLRDLGADFAPMAPAAALAFLLLACGYLATERGGPRARRTAWTASAVVATLALLALVEDLADAGFGTSFAWLLGARGGEMPARMSPATCITLLALALATPLPRRQRILGLSANAVAASAVGAIAFFVLLGLSLRLLRFDIAAPLLGFSASSAVATLLAAIALGAGRPSDWLIDTLTSPRTGAVVMRWLLPAALVVPVVVGWTRLAAERAGLFGEAFGMALFTLMMIASLGALILWVARTLDHIAAQRAQAEGEATEQREWLQVTLAAIGDGVIATDASGQVRFLNPAAQRLTGWRAAEAAGRPIDELLPLFDERDNAPIACPLHAALKLRAAAAASGEPAVRARDGRAYPVQINAAPIIDNEVIAGAVLVLREASAQRRAERAMREAYTELDQRVVRRTAALERASAALR